MDEVKQIAIKKPNNFSFKACLHFLNRGYDECLYYVDDKSVTRLIKISSGIILIQVSAGKTHLNICCHKSKISNDDTTEIKAYVIEWFDLKRDLSEFYQLLESHTQTKIFPQAYHGLRLMGIVNLFEALCWCIIGQQINLTFAHKIKTRLVHNYGHKVRYNNHDYYCFPEPQDLIQVTRDDLVAMQFSKQKINYIYNISQAFCDKQLSKNELLKLPKSEQMDKLLAIKGIGPWTANYVLMKTLRDMTCIAYGDTGLSLSLHKVFATIRKPDKKTIDKIFNNYNGWQSYLNFYLWRSLS